MQLVKRDGRYVAVSSYDERLVPKQAGFRWDRDARCWYTTDTGTASRLAQYAAPDIRGELVAAAVARAAALNASRAKDAAVDIPAPATRSYLPFQRAGIAFSLDRPATLNGDDMGLGKTIQAIGLINARPSIRRVLIVCPATLRVNWKLELEAWLVRPLSIGIATTSAWPTTDIVIVNYDIAEKLRDRLRGETWDLAILDEAHYCKNPKAKRTVAVVGAEGRKGIEADPGIKAGIKLLLSGTPMLNRPAELFPLIHWADPNNWPRFFPYGVRYCGGHQMMAGRRMVWDFSGASHLDELQDRLRRTIMIRRLKTEVLTELPAKRRQVLAIPPNGAQSAVDREIAAWDQHEETIAALRAQVELAKAAESDEEYSVAVARLEEATRVAFTEISARRHETALAKAPAVIAHVADALEGEGKIVVFAHHHDVVAALRDGLAGFNPVVLTGETPMAERQPAVARFQTDPECRVFIGSIMAAGVGLTLTASAHVVFAELDWVPANVTQAEDRTHRIGQQQSVLIQHVVLDGSLDARMAHVLVEKQDILDRALDREPAPLPALPEPAASEMTTRGRVARMAATLSGEQRATIHLAVRRIAGVCDGAHALDACGFNKLDATIGRSLARSQSLTPRQAALGLLIVRKYRRQLGEALSTALDSIAAE